MWSGAQKSANCAVQMNSKKDACGICTEIKGDNDDTNIDDVQYLLKPEAIK